MLLTKPRWHGLPADAPGPPLPCIDQVTPPIKQCSILLLILLPPPQAAGLSPTYSDDSVWTSMWVRRCPEGETSPLLSLWGKPVAGTVVGHQVSVPLRTAVLRGEAAVVREKRPSWETLPEKSPRSSSASKASLCCKCTFNPA